MDKIIGLLLFIIPVWAQSQSAFLDDFKLKWQNASQYTLDMAQAMPQEAYQFKPTTIQMSFEEQVIHISSNMVWLSSAYLGQSEKFRFDLAKIKSTIPNGKEKILQVLESALEYAGEGIEKIAPHELDMQVDFFVPDMNLRRICFLINDHMTHHRGQLIVYLRIQGIKPPGFRGW
jgi:uncharacterized damage-inducible protein DinB